MTTDKNFTRIKETVLDYAMSLWEIDDARLIDSMMMRRRDCITIASGTMIQRLETTSAKPR